MLKVGDKAPLFTLKDRFGEVDESYPAQTALPGLRWVLCYQCRLRFSQKEEGKYLWVGNQYCLPYSHLGEFGDGFKVRN